MPSLVLPRVAAPSTRLLRYLKHQSEQFSHPTKLGSRISCPGRSRKIRLASTSCREVKLLPAPRGYAHGLYNNSRIAPNSPSDACWTSDPYHGPSSLYGSPSHHRRRSSLGETNRPSLRRLFSSGRLSSLWNILGLGLKGQTGARTLDLPPLASFLEDGQSPGRILKPTNEPRLRCTEFDEHGNVTVVNGEFKKTELIAKVCNLTDLTRKALVRLNCQLVWPLAPRST
jgi:hypothetical protein